MAQPPQLPGSPSSGVRASRRLHGLPPEQFTAAPAPTVPPPPPGLVPDVTPPALNGTAQQPQQRNGHDGQQQHQGTHAGQNLNEDLRGTVTQARGNHHPIPPVFMPPPMQPMPPPYFHQAPPPQYMQGIAMQVERQFGGIAQQQYQNGYMQQHQHQQRQNVESQPDQQQDNPRVAQQRNQNMHSNESHASDGSHQSGKSTMSAPQFRRSNTFLHHHGRFYGNVHQLGSEVVNLGNTSQIHDSSLSVLAQDVARLDESIDRINSKIESNKQQLRSFIRDDLSEIIHQQLNAVLDSRYGKRSTDSVPPQSSSDSHSTNSSTHRLRNSSSPPHRQTTDNAGDDDPSSGSSSSSEDSSSDSSGPPELQTTSKKKKKQKSTDSIPSTVDISSESSSLATSTTDSTRPKGNDTGLQSSEFVSALTETLKMAIPAREIKLTALQKESKTAYATWKKNLLSTLTVHRDFKAYIRKNTQKGKYISKSLPLEERETLYQAVYKSISDSIRTSYGLDDLHHTDGIKLLAKMEKEFGLLARSTEERVRLTNDLLAISKHPNETFAAYHKRFSSAVKACQLNKVMPFTANDTLYCHYLKKSGERAFHTIRIEMETSPDSGTAKSWLQSKSLDDLKEKCETFLRTVKQIVGDDSRSRSSTSKDKEKDKDKDKDKAGQDYRERERKLIGGIRKKPSDVVVTHLKYLYRQRKSGCWLHNSDSHKFLKCAKVEEICTKYQCEDCIPLAASNQTQPQANRVSRKQNAKVERRIKASQKEVGNLRKEMKAMRAEMKKLNQPRMESVEEGDEISLSDDESEMDFEEESDEESVDHDEVDNSSVNDNETVNSYPVFNPTVVNHTLKSILLSPSHPKTNKTVTFKSLLGYSKYTNTTQSLQSPSYTVVDSGATEHMDCDKSFFDCIIPVKDEFGNPLYVQQGDGSDLIVEGMGIVTKLINNTIPIRYTSYYIPTLGTALYSVKKHMEFKGCYFHAENNTATLSFPNKNINLFVEPEILFTSRKFTGSPQEIAFDSEQSPKNRKTLKFLKAKMVNAKDFNSAPPLTRDSLPTKSVTFEKRHKRATLPFQSTPGSIGFDVKPLQSTTLLPRQVTKIPLGLACAIPSGLYARLVERSSLGMKGVSVQGGVIDPDYRGEIHVPLINHSDTPILLSQHDHFAQIIFEHAATPMLTLATKLPPTKRGSNGFGSTTTTKRNSGTFSYDRLPLTISGNQRRKAHRSFRPMSEGLHRPRQQDHYLNEMYSDTFISDDPNDDAESPELIPTQPNLQHKQKEATTPEAEPRLRPNEKVNTSTRSNIQMTKDDLSQSIGFLKPDKLLKNLTSLGNGAFTVTQLEKNPKIDPGEVASIKASRRNTTAEAPASNYSDLWHMDIGYGPCRSIGGYSHTLLFVDSASRYKYVYPLKNLTTSLLKNIKRFFKDCKVKPKVIRTDFDNKLMAGKVAAYIEEEQHVDLEAAPPHRQHQNGLVERAWQTITSMARNWLTSSLLPSKYWWFAIKRAVEILNIMPCSHLKKNITTPHEVVFGSKVDYRVLFPMFSVAYIKQPRETGGSSKQKIRTKSLKCILVGSDNKSNGLQFYHPESKQLITANNGFRIDSFLPSGPQFNEKFDGSFIFNTKSGQDNIHRPMTHEDNDKVFFKNKEGSYDEATIVFSPFDDNTEPYTVQVQSNGSLHEFMASDLLDHNPDEIPTDTTSAESPHPLLPWITPHSKVTLYLPQLMPKPKQGYLECSDGEWSFSPGRTGKKKHIPLRNFIELAQSMVTNKKLFQGWKSSATVLTARQIRATSNIMARHVSATTLKVLDTPTLLRHHQLDPHDRELWDAAYDEEYNGLQALQTWETISESEYQRLKQVCGKALPTMAISTLKRDEDGKPKRCKYRIVVLGNLDPHDWQKSDCFAPVLNQTELRLLCSIAVRNKVIPKTGDVSQAFCQGVLPPGEQYILRPPPGCPRSPPNTYWKLLRTLYGLKRSPRHWYELAKKTLIDIGLKPVQNSSCIFYGTLIDNEPPIYIGLYVDDFIYFSKSSKVEKEFEQKFGEKVKTTFDGDVSHFLGITFKPRRYNDGHVSLHLSQEAFTDTLLVKTGLDGPDCASAPTPYRSGYPIDKIPNEDYDLTTQARITHKMQQLTGCFQWLASSTRPDIATVTNFLAQFNHNASKGHLDACKRVVRYLKGTKDLGISFHSRPNATLKSFVKFPVSTTTITPFTDANWGPQDQSRPKPSDPPIDLFKTRSLSGFLIWLNGPIHWMSKRQTITARSTAEAEIYATDECVKYLQYIHQMLDEMNLAKDLMPKPTTIHNDNAACVAWSHSLSTKGLRHIQIRENAVRENVQAGNVKIVHIGGDMNLSDLFTKEDKDVHHFVAIRNVLLEKPPVEVLS